MDDEQQKFSVFLRENGLSDSQWISLFKEEGITHQDHLLAMKGSDEKYEVLAAHAKEEELKALAQLFDVYSDHNPDEEVLDIQRELAEVGLQSDYWSPIFSKQLGVTSKHALEFIGEESLLDLEQFARHAWEKKALRKLLHLEDEKGIVKTQHARQKEKLKQRQEKAEQMLQELKRLQSEGKDRNDKMVQQYEKGVREMLQISPDSWISHDKSLEALITQLQSSHDKISGVLLSRPELSDASVFQSASGGLALQGIKLSENIDDQLQVRSNLLRPPEGIQLLGPSHPQSDRIESFFSKHREDTFKITVDKLGYSVTGSAKAGFWGFGIEASSTYSSSSEEEHKSEQHSEETYYSTIKFSSMPLASCCLNDNQLHLSHDALKGLQLIEALLSTQGAEASRLQSECETFFNRFGSHINRGPLNFGGIYWWKCSTRGFKETEMTTVKQLQGESINTHVSLSYGSFGASADVDYSTVKAKFSGKYSESVISQTLLEVSKTGGPPEISNLPEWKTGLVASNSTWSLIDRGTTLVPVWQIIEMNHNQDFQKTRELALVLKRAWEVMTKIQDASQQGIQDTSQMLIDVLEAVTKWNESKDVSKIEELLDSLLSVKWEIIKETLNPQAWPTIYLSKPPIQQFLIAVVDEHQHSTSSEYIKVLMQQLVERMDLNILSLREFPQKHYISKWLYSTEQQSVLSMECQDFVSLSEYLKLAKDSMITAKANTDIAFGKSAACIPNHVTVRVTASVAKAVYLLQCNLNKNGQKYENMFITTLIYPFKHSTSEMTFNMLSTYDLEYLYNKLRTQSKEFFSFKDRGLLSMQAYLFILAIDPYCNEREIDMSESQAMQHVLYLKQEMGEELESAISDILTEHCLTTGYDWEELQVALEPIMKGLQPVEEQSGHTLQEVLNECKTPSAPLVKPLLRESVPKGNIKAENLFTMLNLTNYYPQKLSLQDALLIRKETLETSHCSDPSQLYLFILHKIMTYDFRCRKNLLIKPEEQHKEDKEQHKEDANDSSSEEESDSDDDSSSDDDSKVLSDQVTKVHPMDGLLTLLHCADDFLRQDLMARLVTCQLAIPFILPDPFTQQLILPLWAMKSIVKEWKCTLSGKAIEREGPIVNYPTPIISFIRFGKHARSKSNMMNDIMNDSHHDHFFHRDCEGGNIKQLLGEGLVETSWYFPSGKTSDIFPDAIMLLNLHGDARHHPKQAAFLGQISFMTFILLTEEDINEKCIEIIQQHSETPGGFVLLLCASEVDRALKQDKLDELKKCIPDKVHSIKLRKKNADEVKKDIRRRLNKRLKEKWITIDPKITLCQCTGIAKKHGIHIDEDNDQFLEGQKLADGFQSVLCDFLLKNPTVSAKESMLPLQGAKMWQKWAENDKEEHRHVNRGSETIEAYSTKKQEEKELIRRRQFQRIQHNLSPLMESFIVSLLNYDGSVRRYFLQCLKSHLDDLSRNNITKLQHRYQNCKLKLLQLQTSKEPNQRSIKQCKEEIQVIHDDMINASFGREHLLRELGQVYEAVVQSHQKKDVEQYTRLPKVAAELMVEGYPLELMDGDAAHVPITWVKAVLHEVVKILHDPQVFVMSVLGLQSTGKSTLMNSAFGLQFNVSAGRCTRGAFMQLLPISKQLKEEVNCDYVLIVDTEGLRAPELDSLKTQKHDNELATFVIGLANVTMINIKGETPGDMDDILQTAVHAFLRMKSVKLNPSCQFIHQNVGAVLASTKGGMGRTRFKHKLDDMTVEAAKEEKCEGQYESFSDVIQFNEQLDVHYFPSLWKGDPPMAPVNDGYSEKAQALKIHLVNTLRETTTRQLSISEFEIRLSDLWKALLHEKFVFSFKNTLEIAAYNTLDAEYGKWAWKLQSEMLEWERIAGNEIENTGSNSEKLKELQERHATEIPTKVDELLLDTNKEMIKYFEESRQREMLAQWQSKTEGRLQNLALELKNHAINYCQQLVSSKQAFAKVEENKVNYRSMILKKVNELIPTMEKGRYLTEEKLKEKFDEQWIEWMQDLKSYQVHEKEINVVASVQSSLRDFFMCEEQIVIKKLKQKHLSEWGKRLNLTVRREVHVRLKKSLTQKFVGLFTGPASLSESHMAQAQTLTNDALSLVKDYLESIRDKQFNPTYTSKILRMLMQYIISDSSKSRCKDISFEQEYRIDLSLTACGYALKQFEKMIENFKKKSDPIQYLELEMKESFLLMFTNQYFNKAKEKAAASQFCGLLSIPLKRQVIDSLPKEVVTQMKDCYTYFTSKKRLKARILHDLGRNLIVKGDFSAYKRYLSNPQYSLKDWIKMYTMEHCNSNGDDGQTMLVCLAKKQLSNMIIMITSRIKIVTDNFKASQWNWLDVFFEDEKLKKELVLDRTTFEELGGGIRELKDIESFKNDVLIELRKIQSNLVSHFEGLTTSALMDELSQKPYDLIFESLRGCSEQCPFCKEECEVTENYHSGDHSVQFHRPQCLGGYRWKDSQEMIYHTCPALVATDNYTFQCKETSGKYHPYKDYRQIKEFKQWSITPDKSAAASTYWKWFVRDYASQIAGYFGAKGEKAHQEWRKYSWEEAKEYLEDEYNLKF